MAASTGIAQPIIPRRRVFSSDAVATMRRMAEKAAQPVNSGVGVPCQVDVAGATGFIILCPIISSVATANIAGFTSEFFHNLGTSGQGTGPGGSPGGVTFGSVQNQPNAVITLDAGPIIDGTIGLYVADDSMLFVGIYGDSNTAANAVLAQAQVGAIRGLTKDAGNNFWYVDNFITTTAAGACVEIVSLIDPIGTLNGRVEFRVTHAAAQLNT